MSPEDRELLMACYQFVQQVFLSVGYVILVGFALASLCVAVGSTLSGWAIKLRNGR